MTIKVDIFYKDGNVETRTSVCFGFLSGVKNVEHLKCFPVIDKELIKSGAAQAYFGLMKESVYGRYLPDTFDEFMKGVEFSGDLPLQLVVNVWSMVRYIDEYPDMVLQAVQMREMFPHVSANVILYLNNGIRIEEGGVIAGRKLGQHNAVESGFISIEGFRLFMRFDELHAKAKFTPFKKECQYYGRSNIFKPSTYTPLIDELSTITTYSPFHIGPVNIKSALRSTDSKFIDTVNALNKIAIGEN